MFSNDYEPYYRNSWALVVGVNSYLHLTPLTYAAKDATSIAAALESKLGFRQENIKLLLDKDATKEAIMTAYFGLIDSVESPDEKVIIFLAGHGAILDGYKGQVGYFVPCDGSKNMRASLIRWEELITNAEFNPAKHVLFLFDACFSGLAFKRDADTGTQRLLTELLQRRSRQVMTAGTADQTVADGGAPAGGNSIFTGYILEGIGGKAAGIGGVLTATGLMHYVYEKLSHDPLAQQTPHYGHVDGDGDLFLLAPNYDLEGTSEQDQIIEPVPEMPEPEPYDISMPHSRRSPFLDANGYRDPAHPNYGRNIWSNNLGIFQVGQSRQAVKTLSWLSVVIEPISYSHLEINLSAEAKRFANYTSQGDGAAKRFFPPRSVKTAHNALVLFDPLDYSPTPFWSSYVRLEKSGNLEFCDAQRSFFSFRDMQAFRYVQIVGLVWQYMFFAKYILGEYGQKGGARMTVSLIGARNTILADFAKGTGKNDKHWVQPGERGILADGDSLLQLTCPDLNLQMGYKFVLSSLDEKASQLIVTNQAEQLGLAYNHQSEPRAFIHGTNEFPWPQYLEFQR